MANPNNTIKPGVTAVPPSVRDKMAAGERQRHALATEPTPSKTGGVKK